MVHLACQQNECIVDIGTALVLNDVFCVLRSSKTSVLLCLDVLHSLLSHTALVKEALAKGGLLVFSPPPPPPPPPFDSLTP